MKIKRLSTFELSEILKEINAIKLRLDYHEHWIAFPMLNSDGETMDIVAKKNSKNYFNQQSEKVIIKFKKDVYEYILSGIVIKKDLTTSVITVSIESSIVLHYSDKHISLDANFDTRIIVPDRRVFEGVVKKISKYDAVILTVLDESILEDLELFVELGMNLNFKLTAKILSKKEIKPDLFEYGIKFTHIKNSDKTKLFKFVNNQSNIHQYVSNDFRVDKVSNANSNSQIALLSYDISENEHIGQIINNFGYGNYFIVGNYGSLRTSILEDEPIVVIIDGKSTSEETVFSVISRLKDDFENVEIVAIIPDNFANIEQQLTQNENSEVNLLYYPLISGELEQILLKYI